MSIDGEIEGSTALSRCSPVVKRAVQDVVLVGGDDQPLDRQPQAAGDMAGEDVAEIAGRHGEADRPLRRAEATAEVK